MFTLARLEDDMRVVPQDLSKTPLEAVTGVINTRFIDRVVPNLGLLVSIYDVDSISGGYIYPNDGAAYFTVIFRAVVFRPFPGEILVGKLKSCSRQGIRISLGFFEDVIVPEHAMQEPSFFNEAEKLWVWKFDGNDMFMDLGEEVRLRVHSLRFHTPPTPQDLAQATGDDKLLGTPARPFAPMEVVGDINGDGLGLTSWWSAPEGEEGAE